MSAGPRKTKRYQNVAESAAALPCSCCCFTLSLCCRPICVEATSTSSAPNHNTLQGEEERGQQRKTKTTWLSVLLLLLLFAVFKQNNAGK